MVAFLWKSLVWWLVRIFLNDICLVGWLVRLFSCLFCVCLFQEKKMENASCSTPTIQPQTQPPQPQIEGQTEINSAAVGGKRKPLKSVVWLHCNKVKKRDETWVDKVVGVCNYCKLEMPTSAKRNGTTSLKTHLEKRCKQSPLYKTHILQELVQQEKPNNLWRYPMRWISIWPIHL